MGVLDQFKLDGKVALVTGCKRGIGRAMAVALAEAGADIVGVSATLGPSGSDVEADVRGLGRSFRGYACDFADRAALYGFIREVKAEVARIDILVNNAGTVRSNSALAQSDDDWDTVLEVNLSAPFVLTRAFGADMVAHGAGKVIFTASLLSFQGGVTVPSYAASKGGVAQLVKAFSNEWASRGVQVNGIAPGYIVTAIAEGILKDPEETARFTARIPAGRWGQVDDLKGPTVFLASAASDYVTGEILTVDGGWMGR